MMQRIHGNHEVAPAPDEGRPVVLLADDDASFIASLQDALSGEPYDLLIATDGEAARKLLRKNHVDLLVTDIRMPKVDGAELVAEICRSDRPVPCIVMTAFGTPEMELKLERMGILELINKPIEVGELRQQVRRGLQQAAEGSLLRGLSVSSFLQLLAMERKTCTVRVKRGADTGLLFFRKGRVLDASLGERTSLDAAFELLTWEEAEITVENHCRVKNDSINIGLEGLLLEAMRRKDEEERGPGSSRPHAEEPTHRRSDMALEDYLQEFKEIKGYLASGVMDFTGETLVTDSVSSNVDLEATGAVFNDIFRNAHEASGKIGLEACQKMSISTPKGLIVMQCSGVDAPSHLHGIVVLQQDGNQALARNTLDRILPKFVAEMS